MNGPAWALLAIHFLIFAVYLYVVRRALKATPLRSVGYRAFLGVVGLMAFAPCIVIPVFAKPGKQNGLSQLIMFLAMPAVIVVGQECGAKIRRSRHS